MIDLKAKPYCLSDEDIVWVKDTIRSMTAEEKVGQLFFQLTAGMDETYLKTLMDKYHLGGCRYNNMPGAAVQMQNAILQKHSKIPLQRNEFCLTSSCVLQSLEGSLQEGLSWKPGAWQFEKLHRSSSVRGS